MGRCNMYSCFGKKFSIVLAVLICLVLVCSGLESTPASAKNSTGTSKKKTTEKATKTSKTTVEVKQGKKKKISFKSKEEVIKWSSSNKKIATVSKTGKITAVKVGKCVVSAETKSTIYKFNVSVYEKKKVTPEKFTDSESYIKALVNIQKDKKFKVDLSATSAKETHSNRIIVGGTPDLTGLSDVKAFKTPWGETIIQFNDTDTAQNFIKEQKKNSKVDYVVEDTPVYSEATSKVSSALDSWGTKYVGAVAMAQYIVDEKLNKEKVVAVVDSGVDMNHSFLKQRLLNTGYDMVDADNDPSDAINGHGTHVAGTVVDCTPTLSVKVLPLRVLDSEGHGWTSSVCNGIYYAADHGADVINLSLGGNKNEAVDRAVRYASNRGVAVVASAGNDKTDVSKLSPAHLKECIVVAGIDSKGDRYSDSNYGSTVDVTAPAVSIYSSVPNGKYAFYTGTSMAAPHVSAGAAMLKMIYPSYTPEDIENWIKKYSLDLGPQGRDDIYGSGALKLDAIVPASLTGIMISSNPYKMNYKVGETLDTEGMVIWGKLSDGTTKLIGTGYTCTPEKFTKVGTQKVEVKFEKFTTSFEVKVSDGKPTKLIVDRVPNKVNYVEGETLDSDGIILIAKFADGSEEEVTGGFTCSPMSLEKAGYQKITVKYEGLTCDFEVSVRENAVEKIELLSTPNKLEYIEGENFDTTGMTVLATYLNGKMEEITQGYSYTPQVLDTPGTQTITISYEDVECYLNVTVNELRATSLEVIAEPQQTEYYVGDYLDTTGLVLNVEYSDGSHEEISEGFTCNPGYLDTPGTQRIEVSYKGLSAVFNVTVRELVLEGISILKMPNKTAYFDGETLNVDGLVLAGHYSDGSEVPIYYGFNYGPTTLTLSNVGQMSGDYVEGRTINVEYEGFTTTFDVVISANSVVSVSVVNNPTNLRYFVGDTIDASGMVLSVEFSNGIRLNVDSGYNISPSVVAASGYTTVTVNYAGAETTYDIEGVQPRATSLYIQSNPFKTTFYKNEAIDINGMVVKARFENGTERVVQYGEYLVSPRSFSSVGTQKVTVSYSNLTATFNVTILNNERTVTFNGNGGSVAYSSKTVIKNNAYGDLPNASRTYYTFEGWYTSASGGSRVNSSTIYTLDTNQTLYAHWTQKGFGEWSGWSTTSVSGNENRIVESRRVEVSYNMVTIVCGNSRGARCWLPYMQNGYTRRAEDYTAVFSVKDLQSSAVYTTGSLFDYWDGTACDGYIIGPGNAYVRSGDYIPYYIASTNYQTQYRYRDRIK